MNTMNGKTIPIALAALLALAGGCADTGGPRYGTMYGANPEASPAYGQGSDYREARRPAAYAGYVSEVENIRVQPGYRFGVGSVIGAVAGGLLGSQIGEGSGSTAATIAGAAIGGAAGTAAEQRLQHEETASRVTVSLYGGGSATIVQPYDPQIRRGQRVEIVGRGESARVVPAA